MIKICLPKLFGKFDDTVCHLFTPITENYESTILPLPLYREEAFVEVYLYTLSTMNIIFSYIFFLLCLIDKQSPTMTGIYCSLNCEGVTRQAVWTFSTVAGGLNVK